MDSEWISVEERYPEDRELVIGYTPVDGYMFIGYVQTYPKYSSVYPPEKRTERKWNIITAMRSTKIIHKRVTHWMPLPDPPKEL